MNILVANDDGIRADGLRFLVERLAREHRVYVTAPHTQRSASGHSITIIRSLGIREVPFDFAALALEVDGTPADCVKLGIHYLQQKEIPIDLVFSGINHGGNLGTDTLYSGTVGAAMEGAFLGFPAVAVSINSHFPDDFGYAAELASELCRNNGHKMTPGTVLNVNVPNLPKEEIKGIRLTRLGRREYEEAFREEEAENGVRRFRYTARPVFYENLPADIDVIAMQEGYATVTPLHYDLTEYRLIDEMKQWGIEK